MNLAHSEPDAMMLVPPPVRAMAAALTMFLFNLIGLGLGPLCVGFLGDWLGPGNGLRRGMACATFGELVAASLSWTARTSLVRDTIS